MFNISIHDIVVSAIFELNCDSKLEMNNNIILRMSFCVMLIFTHIYGSLHFIFNGQPRRRRSYEHWIRCDWPFEIGVEKQIKLNIWIINIIMNKWYLGGILLCAWCHWSFKLFVDQWSLNKWIEISFRPVSKIVSLISFNMILSGCVAVVHNNNISNIIEGKQNETSYWRYFLMLCTRNISSKETLV